MRAIRADINATFLYVSVMVSNAEGRARYKKRENARTSGTCRYGGETTKRITTMKLK